MKTFHIISAILFMLFLYKMNIYHHEGIISVKINKNKRELYHHQDSSNVNTFKRLTDDKTFGNLDYEKNITFISVLCNDYGKDNIKDSTMREFMVLLKSAAMLTKTNIRFYILTDSDNLPVTLEALIKKWPIKYSDRLLISYYKPAYPPGYEHMKYMWAPYSTIRIFIHDIFPDLDAAIYIDVDHIFLTSPEELWEEFANFNDIQLAAMGPTNAYKRLHRTIPYLRPHGVTACTLMMNLTRIRMIKQYNTNATIPIQGDWTEAMLTTYDSYKPQLKLAEQDMLNIFFAQNPELIYVLGCWWAFTKHWCLMQDTCLPHMVSENKGVALLHGTANTFISHQEPKIQVVFSCFENHNLSSPVAELLLSLKQTLTATLISTNTSKCETLENIDDLLSIELEKYV